MRLTVAFALAMALLLVAVSVFIYERVEFALDRALISELQSSFRDLETDISDASISNDTPLSQPYTQVLSADGDLLNSSAGFNHPHILTSDQLTSVRRHAMYFDRASLTARSEPTFRMYARPISARGVTVIGLVGARRDHRDEALRELLAQLLIGNLLALTIASFIGYRLTRAALEPVEDMRLRAQEISAHNSGQRLPLPSTNDEVRRLGQTINQMLERLEEGLLRERQFVADASHELRTPLALIKTELELALRQPRSADELRDAVMSATEETNRLAQLADDLLLIAHSEHASSSRKMMDVDVITLITDVLRRFEPQAQKGGRTLATDVAPEERFLGDTQQLERALTNMVDNALRYGTGTVNVSTQQSPTGIEIHVTDSGPGFPPDFLRHAFERFSRPDHGRHGPGSGLGLAIVEAIARAHSGTAHAANLPEKGADVWICLPTRQLTTQ